MEDTFNEIDLVKEEFLYYWIEAVNDGNTLLGYREWLASISEEDY